MCLPRSISTWPSPPEVIADNAPITFRDPVPGDIGWVIERHGALYAAEYGWNQQFEALVAEVAAAFLRQHDPATERCWIALRNGTRVGCVFLVRIDDQTAKLRLLLVDPLARGFGLGGRLVDECISFARAIGYKRIQLWTNNVLHSARKIYETRGFQRILSEPNNEFGPELIAETWQLTL